MKIASVLLGLIGLSIAGLASRQLVHPAVWQHPWLTGACLAVAVALVGWGPLGALRGGIRSLFLASGTGSFSVAIGLLGTASYGWLAHRLFEAVPRLDDSVAAIYSARLFLSGRLTAPLPEHPQFFELFGILSAADGVPHLAGIYPPGWSLLLMPGVAVGLAWLVNPILGGALAITVTALGSELYDAAVGRVAGVLVVTSPLLGAISATHLSHTSTALLCCVCCWAVVRLTRTGQVRYGWLAGSALGLALLERPATAVVVGAVIALLPLSSPRRILAQWRANGAALSMVALSALLLLGYQQATTGNALLPGHLLQLGDHRGLGWVQFLPQEAHTPARAIDLTRERLEVVDRDLLGWPLPAAVIVLAPFLLGSGRWRELWLLAPFLALLAFFAGFWYLPAHLPGRYLTSGLPTLFVLCAVGWSRARRRLEGAPGWRRLPDTLLAFGLLFAVVCGGPGYFATFRPHFGDVETLLPATVERHDLHDALVLMTARGKWKGAADPLNDYYASGFRLNDLALEGDVIYARSLGAQDSILLDQHPTRSHYLYVFFRNDQRARISRISRNAEGQLIRKPLRWTHRLLEPDQDEPIQP